MSQNIFKSVWQITTILPKFNKENTSLWSLDCPFFIAATFDFLQHLFKFSIWYAWNHKRTSWSYSSWIYNYLCNQCLWPLTLRVRILLMVRCTR